jgi:betaine-aldehyde dehydrogenase
VWINTYHHFYPEAEVGGFKKSGLGRQQGLGGLAEFTETKHLNFDSKATLW